MMIDWQQVITTVGGQTVLLGAAAWLIKTVVSSNLTRDSERFKTQLKADADVTIERLKNDLQLSAIEHQVRFSNLHQKRAEVIAETYSQMVNMFYFGQQFIFSGSFKPAERSKEFGDAHQKLREFYLFIETNRVYLPAPVCALLDDFFSALQKPVIRVGVYSTIEYPTEQTSQEKHEALMKAYEDFEKTIPNIRKALEDEFRTLLGEVKCPLVLTNASANSAT